MPCAKCSSCFFEWDWQLRVLVCQRCGHAKDQYEYAVDALELDDEADSLEDQQRPDYHGEPE